MGTAIIIKGANFADNNLGKVIINSIPLEERVVSEYLNKTSGTYNYKIALETLVKELNDADLWNKTKVLYPILGDSLKSMSVNLASDNQYPMILKENAEAKTNHLYFSNKIEVSATTTESGNAVFSNTVDENLGVFVRFRREDSESLNSSVLTRYGTGGLYTVLVSGSPNARGLNMNFISSRVLQYPSGLSEKRNYAYVNENTLCKMYVGDSVVLENSFPESTAIVNYSGIFGVGASYTPTATPGETISANKDLASGELYTFVYGNYSNEDMVKLTTIMNNFMNSVGK